MVQLNDAFDNARASRTLATTRAAGTPSTSSPSSTRPSTTPSNGPLPSLSPSTLRLLCLLASLFTPLRLSPSFAPTLQHVKSLLFSKQYLAAFGTPGEEGERWREAYVSRWTPARAVVYERVWGEVGVAGMLGWADGEGEKGGKGEESEEEELEEERKRARRRREWRREGKTQAEIDELEKEEEVKERLEREKQRRTEKEEQPDEVGVLMIGAGAGAEVVALGAALGAEAEAEDAARQPDQPRRKRPRVKVQAVDQGQWGSLLTKMRDGLTKEWPVLSPSADGEDGGFEVDFLQADALTAFSSEPSSSTASSPAPPPPQPALLHSPRLITICFTISELLLQSRASTLRFLSSLSSSSLPGTHLLIIESASLSLIALGSSGQSFPLGGFLDLALCGKKGEKGIWEKLRGEEGKWYRMPIGAEEAYNPVGSGATVKLENTRVLLRLYRRK
ncbi:hypothetical protein JCM8547_005862 [Rhodosporidiobolus lusitaniae]